MELTLVLDDTSHSALYIDGTLAEENNDQDYLQERVIDHLIARLRRYEPNTALVYRYPKDGVDAGRFRDYPNDLASVEALTDAG